ncbi:MAG TPA: type II secretion system protein GspC [Anaeromyxobacteraceae bacterium]|nr:type II secretion system protein GspC [Anaeromyxobacteraceae bacterium]
MARRLLERSGGSRPAKAMLDSFFKKYAFAANLAVIFAAAWLCARMVNTVAGAALRPRPVVDLATSPALPPRPAATPTFDPDRLYALIGQKPPAPPPTPAAPGAPAEGPSAPAADERACRDGRVAPGKTSLRGQLVACVLAEDPRASLASITDLATRETRIYGLGDRFQNATLISVERLRDPNDSVGSAFKVAAIFCNDGKKEYLEFEPGEVAPTVMAPGRPAPPGGEEAVDGVHKLADNRYDVKKKYIDDTLSNLSAVATQARIVPSFKNGVANGFKLFSIQPGSLYSAIGVENGDVIQRVNGYEINSPDKALEIYQKLRESSHITLEIERNGQIIRKEYNVTGS